MKWATLSASTACFAQCSRKSNLGADAPKLGEMDQNVIDELLPSVPILVLD
jgi:hypothetical protein